MVNIPYIAPPDLSPRDYSASLYNAAKGFGDTIYQNRRDRVEDLQFSQEQQRLKAAGEMDYAAAMARIAAESDPFGTGAGSLPGASAEITYMNALNQLDPSDPRWATAWYQTYGKPDFALKTTPTGEVPTYYYRPVPPDIAAKAAAAGFTIPTPGASVAGTAPATDPADTGVEPPPPPPPALGGGRVVTDPALAGTKPAPTIGQARDEQLYSIMEQELPVLENKWASLDYGPAAAATQLGIDPYWQQLGTSLTGIDITNPDYQEASNSLNTIISMFIYSASGATATEAEVQRLSEMLRPIPGEGDAAKAGKLARVRQLVASVQGKTSGWMVDEAAREAAIKSGAGLSGGGGGGGGAEIEAGDGIIFRRK